MDRHLLQHELADRWKISPCTLERWRWLQIGPPYLKLNGRVVYRFMDVEAYEAEHLHRTSRGASQTPINQK